MYSFANDYSEGAHPRILEALMNHNLNQNPGYGHDEHCGRAAALIKEECGREDIDVHFIPGGTQTNLLVIASALRPHEAVICAATGHINCHETGAIEATGHKILTVPSGDGKVTVPELQKIVTLHHAEYTVLPKMVYISDTTELGTLYTKRELEELHHFCRLHDLYLFVDGARLASALTSIYNDAAMKDLAELADVFYIGGTKNGALFGEALVIVNPQLKPYFRFHLKQRGAMLAKGFLLGLQFEVLFTDGLYYQLGEYANAMAMTLKRGLEECGLAFLAPPCSNQLFPIVTNELAEYLAKDYRYETEREFEDGTRAIRFVTSWATPEKEVRELIASIQLFMR